MVITLCKKKKKISLGLMGSTVADIKFHNSESIDLINTHQDIFEIILRPWSHDVGIYRNNDTFLYNVEMGIKTLEAEFTNVVRYFLSPEFMINSKQIELLEQHNIEAIFINPTRYDNQTASRICKLPYEVQATSGAYMNCISIEGCTMKAFLLSMQQYDKNVWNECILNCQTKFVYSWRDGESSFLLKNGIERESFWLEHESENINRYFLKDLNINYIKNKDLKNSYYKNYPIHSFLAWMQDMKMMWYINKVSEIENNFKNLTHNEKILFLQLINSDILASVEKNSPIIDIVVNNKSEKFTIYRQEKGFEGEEYLSAFNGAALKNNSIIFQKFIARKSYLTSMIGENYNK